MDDFACHSKPDGDEYDYIEEGTFEVPCSGDDVWLPFSDISCAEFTEEHCENATVEYHEVCGNKVEDGVEQAVTFYLVTGNMFIYPEAENPAEQTLMDGLDAKLGYTESDTSKYRRVDINTGRWMAIQNLAGKYTIRQITVWYEHTETASLSMTLYKGKGVTGSVKLETISVTLHSIFCFVLFC